MTFNEFKTIWIEQLDKHPLWMECNDNSTCTDEDIVIIQKYLGVVLPENFKLFSEQFGGGHVAYVLIYSLDRSSKYYILDYNTLDRIKKDSYIAVIDNHTGDTSGFLIKNGICSEEIYFYDHETGEITYSGYDSILDYIVYKGFKL